MRSRQTELRDRYLRSDAALPRLSDGPLHPDRPLIAVRPAGLPDGGVCCDDRAGGSEDA